MVGSDRPRRMSAILLALGSALSYGAADFIAGWLSRRDHYARVALLTQLAAASGTVLVSVLVGGRPSTASLVWGAVSGLGGGLGTLALYRGLARGRMNVVAPLSGVLAAGLPALFGVALGERPSTTATLGLVLALPAVWLTARGEGGAPTGAAGSSSVLDGVLAGLGFTVLFIGLQRAGSGDRAVARCVLAGGVAAPDGLALRSDREGSTRQPAGALDTVRSGADGCSRRAGGDLLLPGDTARAPDGRRGADLAVPGSDRRPRPLAALGEDRPVAGRGAGSARRWRSR